MEANGEITATRIVELKFQIGGRLNLVSCQAGEAVKKGQLLASLEKTELQAYLDRALKQYDLERALFDEKQKEELTEFERRKYQDSLDISVKNVEIAKANLDATNLCSPMDGIVAKIDSGMKGVNITPAGFVITVFDPQSFVFQAEVSEENLNQTSVGQQVKVGLKIGRTLDGKIDRIGYLPVGKWLYPVKISISDTSDLRIGLTGKIMV